MSLALCPETAELPMSTTTVDVTDRPRPDKDGACVAAYEDAAREALALMVEARNRALHLLADFPPCPDERDCDLSDLLAGFATESDAFALRLTLAFDGSMTRDEMNNAERMDLIGRVVRFGDRLAVGIPIRDDLEPDRPEERTISRLPSHTMKLCVIPADRLHIGAKGGRP